MVRSSPFLLGTVSDVRNINQRIFGGVGVVLHWKLNPTERSLKGSAKQTKATKTNHRKGSGDFGTVCVGPERERKCAKGRTLFNDDYYASYFIWSKCLCPLIRLTVIRFLWFISTIYLHYRPFILAAFQLYLFIYLGYPVVCFCIWVRHDCKRKANDNFYGIPEQQHSKRGIWWNWSLFKVELKYFRGEHNTASSKRYACPFILGRTK